MPIKQLNKLKRSTKNKGFIALSIAVWVFIVLSTVVAVQSQWLFVYIDEVFYKNEIARLEDMANRCLEYAYNIHISGVDEMFIWKKEKDTCFAKTGDKLSATTTNKRFWFAKSIEL